MSKFASLLAKMPEGLKKFAGIESPDQMQLEQDFGRLAYSFLSDRAGGLLPYVLGFEVVDREEDGSRAIGIFGFKIGDDYYYVPAFFINNQIKGMDLLYSKRTNLFVPLRESWINYITNRQTVSLGKNVDESKELRKDFENPRFDFLTTPPESSSGTPKTAESKDASAAIDSIHDGFNKWNIMQQSLVDSLEKDSEFQTAWACAVSRLEKHDLPIEKTADNSRLIAWLGEKGGVRAVNSLMRTLTLSHDFAKAAMTFYPRPETLMINEFSKDLEPEKKATRITVLTQSDLDSGDSSISEDGKKRLVRDGFTIHDTRDNEEKSEAYEIDYEQRFHNPDKSGLYNVLLRNGGTTKSWVFMPSGSAKSDSCVVVETANKNYFLAEPGAIFVRGDEIEDQDKSAYSKTIMLSRMKIGQTYIMLDKNNCSSLPFKINAVIAENGKRTKMRINWHSSSKIKRPTYGHDFETLHTEDKVVDLDSSGDYIQLAEYENGALTYSGTDTIVAPSGWRAFKLNTGKRSAVDSYEARQIMEDMFQPGTLTDVTEALTKNALHTLLVGSDDSLEYYMRFDNDFVDGPPVNYKTAAVKLVSRYGLKVDDAETMLKEARENFKSRRLIKLGQMVGVNMPPAPPQAMGSDQFTGATTVAPQVNQMQGNMTGVPPLQNPVTPGFNIGGEAQMDIGAANVAQQAAGAGQKQVFDHAAIGGLAHLYDSGSVIDSYVPELMQALDRLGRILFLFYWKNEEFAERYGSEELSEMEDMIRGVFKSYGDLVLKLRQRAIDSEDADNSVT